MKKRVGNYRLGLRPIRLFMDPDSANGSVDLMPSDGGSTIVNVGVRCSWGETVTVLLHELYECVLIDLNTRYKMKPSYSEESSDFMFFMSHNQLGETHERVGYLIAHMIADFRKAYKKYSTHPVV